jgi:hypothetical protein
MVDLEGEICRVTKHSTIASRILKNILMHIHLVVDMRGRHVAHVFMYVKFSGGQSGLLQSNS